MDELLGRDSLLEHPRLKEFKDILLHARNPLDVNDSIDNLQKGGFEVIDRIDKFVSVRVKIHDPVKFAKFIEDHDDDFDLSKNFTLRRPTYPDSRILEIEEPFMGSSMDWLGVRSDRKHAGSGVKVAILDTGVDVRHESLSINIREISLLDESGTHGNLGHGTGIASVIAGQEEDFMGIAPSSEILSVRF